MRKLLFVAALLLVSSSIASAGIIRHVIKPVAKKAVSAGKTIVSKTVHAGRTVVY